MRTMRSSVCAVIVILLLVSLSGCTEDSEEGTNPPVNWASKSGHSEGIFYDIITEKDVYNESELVNISLVLHSTLDHNVTLTYGRTPGYDLFITDEKGRHQRQPYFCSWIQMVNYTVIPNSSEPIDHWCWNQSFLGNSGGPFNRNQEVTITCILNTTGNQSYNPMGWKTIWLK